MRLKWLEEVGQRIAEIEKPEKCLETEGLKPVDPENGEKVVGRLSGDLLGLYALILRLKKEGEALAAAYNVEHSAGVTPAFREKVYAEADRTDSQFKALQSLFWTAVRCEFGVVDDVVGIRTNGDVVAYKSPDLVDEIETRISAITLDQLMVMLASRGNLRSGRT